MDTIIEGQIEKPMTPIIREQGESITMDFPEAMREVLNKGKVRRIEWPDGDYGLLKDGWLTIYTKGKFHTWLVSDGDMEAQDWFVIKEN